MALIDLDKRLSRSHSRFGHLDKTVGPTENLDKRISSPHSTFGQETWGDPTFGLVAVENTIICAPTGVEPYHTTPRDNHYSVLVTEWWSQAVTNTSINHAQCCSIGAWYDHEKNTWREKCTAVLQACWPFHSFTCSHIRDRVRGTWVSST